MEKKSVFQKFNLAIFIPMILLIIYGTMIILSTVIQEDSAPLENDFFVGHLLNIVIGLIVFLIISQIDYRFFYHLFIPIFILTIILLALIPFLGIVTKGSARWLDLGFFSFQPSEFAKPFLCLSLSAYLVKFQNRLSHFLYFLLSLIMTLIIAFLIFIQPDLGTSLVSLVIWVGTIFFLGFRIEEFLFLLFSTGISLPLIYSQLHDYQKNRILTFLNPKRDPLESGYAVLQSIIAVGSGQFLGMGWGRGTQSQLRFLPERQTDFIFATLSEELGFVGIFLLIILFALLFFFILQIVKNTNDVYGKLIIIGILSYLLFQFTINIGMNIGIMPITGIPLPFISYGGSSLISSMMALGIVQSVYRFGKEEYSNSYLAVNKPF